MAACNFSSFWWVHLVIWFSNKNEFFHGDQQACGISKLSLQEAGENNNNLCILNLKITVVICSQYIPSRDVRTNLPMPCLTVRMNIKNAG
jgi:hypothetical protein